MSVRFIHGDSRTPSVEDGVYVASDEDDANYPNFLRKTEKRLAQAQRKLSKRQKGSHNREKQRLRVAVLHEKIANQRRDFLHKKARDLVDNYDAIGIEDISVKAMAKRKKGGKLTSRYNIPHGEACGLTLDYFARLNGRHDLRVQQLASQLEFQDSEALGNEIFQLKKDIGLRTDLRDLHLDEKAVQSLVLASHHPNLKNNLYPITDEILQDLYQRLI